MNWQDKLAGILAVRNIVPGRKTDVKDSEWIADLLRHGLLNSSFIPTLRELKELVRYRRSMVQERARELNRIQKVLEGANIKLASVVSDIDGTSSRRMLDMLISGCTAHKTVKSFFKLRYFLTHSHNRFK